VTSKTGMAIDYFNSRHVLHRVKAVVALRARRGMYQRVLGLANPSRDSRILDVGTTPDLAIAYNNFFERWYPYPERLTACSIEDCSVLEAHFPGLTFRLTDGRRLPFDDQEFDLAPSFAVLEHVGGSEAQRHFLSELARVSRAFIAYTPYRYFPIEMHTLLPLTHWLPAAAYRALWRRVGMDFWAEERNLNLLSLRTVRALLPRAGSARIRLMRTFGWPSNIEVYWRRELPPARH
jgi:Methyltransferase domain